MNSPPKLDSLDPSRLPLRPKAAIPIVTEGAVVAASFPWKVGARIGVVVVAKTTFALRHEGAAEPLAEQDALSGDVYEDEDTGSLRYASDFAPFKPKADILLVGHAYPETSRSHTTSVLLRFGSVVQGGIAVVGDRAWTPEGPTSPRPFERIALRYENAFGGAGHDPNPIGAGLVSGVGGGRLPNLEQPNRMIKSQGDRPAPACFAPLPRTWAARTSKMGRYDDAWLKERWPYFPADFDWSHFNAAPIELRAAYPRGDESFSLAGVVPGARVLNGFLPGLVARAYAHPPASSTAPMREVHLSIDSVWFDADALKIAVVSRGFIETSSDLAPEIAAFFVALEPLARAADVAAAQERCRAQLAADRGAPPATGPRDAPAAVSAGVSTAATEGGTESREHAPTLPVPPTLDRSVVVACVASGAPLEGLDLSGCDLSDLDLSRRKLSGTRFVGAKLSGTRFDGADLTAAVLARTSGYRASFRGADLGGANLAGAELVEADFTAARLEEASMADASCPRSKLDRARLSRAVLTDTDFEGATFDDANLTAVDLSSANLVAASFRKAVLDDAAIYGANAERASFDDASLARFRADGANLVKSSFQRARANGSSFESARLAGAVLTEAELDDTVFAEADLERAVLTRATARASRFRYARLPHANAARANLMEASFEGADLSHADFRGANLYAVQGWKATIAGLLLDQAIVAGAKLG